MFGPHTFGKLLRAFRRHPKKSFNGLQVEFVVQQSGETRQKHPGEDGSGRPGPSRVRSPGARAACEEQPQGHPLPSDRFQVPLQEGPLFTVLVEMHRYRLYNTLRSTFSDRFLYVSILLRQLVISKLESVHSYSWRIDGDVLGFESDHSRSEQQISRETSSGLVLVELR